MPVPMLDEWIFCRHFRNRALARWNIDVLSVLAEECSLIAAFIQIFGNVVNILDSLL